MSELHLTDNAPGNRVKAKCGCILTGDDDGRTGVSFIYCPLHAAAKPMVEALKELLEWERRLGGWESPCWEKAAAALRTAGIKFKRGI